ncbi:MAG: DEAD/DEAH box helicase, partial [Acidobacteriota bacterium]
RRKSVAVAQTAATSLRKRAFARTTAGRWSLLVDTAPHSDAPVKLARASEEQKQKAIEAAKRAAEAMDAQARMLLCRYGVLMRDLLARESNAPKWRDLLPVLRRLEARGEIRGGRFVSGPFGEQYALAEAVDSLRAARRESAARVGEAEIVVAAADPLNLVGIVVPGERVAAVPGKEVRFVNGAVVAEAGAEPVVERPVKAARRRSVADMLRAEAGVTRAPQAAASPGLFS